MKKIVYIIIMLFIGDLFVNNTINVFAYNQNNTFITINNLESYRKVNSYSRGKYKNVGDYIHKFIRGAMMKWLSKEKKKIVSFKELERVKKLHTKLEKILKAKKSDKVESLVLYLDDLIYNYSDVIYKDLLILHNNKLNNTNNIIINNNSNNNINRSGKTYYDRNTNNDNINEQLLKEYMCSEDYTKSVIDYGCGTKDFSNNRIYQEKERLSKLYKKNGYNFVSKYNYYDAIKLLNNKINFEHFKNFLYKSSYLLSPGGFTYAFLFSKVGYEKNVYDNLWYVNYKNNDSDKYWEGLSKQVMKILIDNNYKPYQYTKFKEIMDYLK